MMNGQKFALFGASKTGLTIAHGMQKTGMIPQAIWNRSLNKLENIKDIIPFKNIINEKSDLSDIDWIMIAVSDNAIQPVAEFIANTFTLKPEVRIFHISGAHDSSLLESVAAKGHMTGSMHPLVSIPDVEKGLVALPKIIFSCEGKIQSELVELAQKISKNGIAITREQKQTLHIMAVFMNNFITTLVHMVSKLGQENGLSSQSASQLLNLVTLQAVKRGWSEKLSAVLTGPAVRGDINTIESHLSQLEKHSELTQLYREFTITILNTIEAEDKEISQSDEIRKLLDS